MNDWLVFAVAGVTTVILVFVARLLSRLEIDGFEASELDVDTYTKGTLSLVAQRATEEGVFTEFCRPSEIWQEEVELCESSHGSYTRLSFDFPNPLHLGIRLRSDKDEGLVNRLMQLRELEIGDEVFDAAFLIFAHEPERLMALFDVERRAAFVELAGKVDDLRLTDSGALLLIQRILSVVELEALASEAHEVFESFHTAGRALLEDERRSKDEGNLDDPDRGAFRLPRHGIDIKKPG